MKRMLAACFAAALLGTTGSLAQDYKVGPIKIEAPWTRATPVGSKVAGGYMKIENAGSVPDRLIGGSVVAADKFEVHEMAMVGDIMKMRELANGLEIAPGKSVELKPGSFHVMFMDLKQTLKEGDKVKGTLKFEKAGTVEVEYSVRTMGAQGGPDMKKH